MIKHIPYLLLSALFLACNSENANDCFQTSGTVIQHTVTVTPFDKITVNEGIEMVIEEGITHEVVVEAGDNLLNDIQVDVVNDRLILSNHNSCNFFRNYDPAKVYVTAPNITEIRSATPSDIRSEGVLNYPQLHILSEDYSGDYLNSGDFYLTVNTTDFRVTFNSLSNCFISGETETLHIAYASGNSRFEGGNLIARQIDILHRSSNDIIIHPTEVLEGDILSTGHIIALNEPPTVNVVEHYKGKLIFQN
ncbi:MAG: head GIN domain-containing protein [Bacteroidota bacterium]